MKCIVDTNVVMLNHDLSQYEKVYVPLPVLEELDKHNHSSDERLAYEARAGLRMLRDLDFVKHNIVFQCFFVQNSDISWLDLSIKDNLILLYAKYIQEALEPEAILITNDLNMYQKALALSVKVSLLDFNFEEDIYKGYIKFTGTEEEYADFYTNIDYNNWYTNQYLIFENTNTGKSQEWRFNGNDFVRLKLPSSDYIKAKTSLQRCALDLLMNDEITIVAVMGGYGSGKTYLCTQMALYHLKAANSNKAKILGVREPRGEGKDVGYLKGTFEDKTGKFFKPIEQQLKGGEFELDRLISRGELETTIPFYMKGTTYDSTIMVVDEAEDLTESQLKLIGTRLGEDSKVYFSGDYSQSVLNKSTSNPLVKMCNQLKGNPMFGCIYLDKDVRSETSKLFANLFK